MNFKLCFAPFVFGVFSRYIPFYIYSILKSYPDYFVKIFFRDFLSDKEKQCLNFLRENVSLNFEIIENFYKDVKTEHPKLLRWLIKEENFLNFENIYFGDIDFLIVKEKPSILESHLDHCKKINLPYSNVIRKNSKRMSGLLFIKRKEYYEKMNEEINYFLNNQDKLKEFEILERSPNEHFLYYLISKKIGFGLLNQFPDWRPHHGFHLGYCFKDTINPKLKPHNIKYLMSFRDQIDNFFKDEIFIKMTEILDNDNIKSNIRAIKGFYNKNNI